jgi:hypothetical protein
LGNFDDLIGSEGLTPEEEAKLRRVHELLVQVGPPPDLSPELELPPVPSEQADPPEVAYLLRRRRGLAAVLALAAALAAFVGGYAFGHSKGKPAAFAASRVVPMHAPQRAGTHGVIRIARSDSVGNWPMLVEVSGLPQQANRQAYYELWLTHKGKPVAPCGSFRVHSKTTRVRLTVPYELKGYDGWVVTAQPAEVHTPGPVVLTT